MDSLYTSILSTLALHDAESCSAFSYEDLYQYLHKELNTKHISNIKPSVRKFSQYLDNLINIKLIFIHDGLYVLYNHKDLSMQKNERIQTSAHKLKHAHIPLFLLEAFPFIQHIAITGSIAMQNAKEKSDIDILCITTKNRIWTTRICALILAQLFGMRKEHSRSGEKLCFNYFLTHATEAPMQNIASANMFAHAIPIINKKDFAIFFKTNSWITNFLYKIPQKPKENKNKIHIRAYIKKTIEYFLNGKIGDILEKIFRWWQKKRLEKKRTPVHADHFILSDTVLMLHHPKPKNIEVMRKYQKNMMHLTKQLLNSQLQN